MGQQQQLYHNEEEEEEKRKQSEIEHEQTKNSLIDTKLQRDNIQIKLNEVQSKYNTEKLNHQEAMDKVKMKLLEYQNWVKVAQEKEGELKSDKKQQKSKIKEILQQT